MIYHFTLYLKNVLGVKIPAALAYTSTRMMLAGITALLISVLCGPAFIRLLYRLKVGQWIRKEECPKLGELHAKKQNTPTMGGLLILFSMVVSLLLWMDLTSPFTLILLVTTLLLGFLGGIDDYNKIKFRNAKGIRGRNKLLLQGLLSLFVAAYLYIPAVSETLHRGSWFTPPTAKDRFVSGAEKEMTLKEYASQIYAPFFKGPILTLKGWLVILGFILTFFVITGSSNAVNLTDGLDGLAAGCLIMVASCFALIAFVSNNAEFSRYLNILYIEGSGEIAIYLSAFVGACLGFLWYNSSPAEVFMGDIGSLSLGGVLGVSAVLLRKELLLAIVGGVFVMEAVSVILQVGSFRLRGKKRIFLCAPLHHHFEYKGWPETKVVVRFWIVSALLAIIGGLSFKIQ